jgi:hypothetical protein
MQMLSVSDRRINSGSGVLLGVLTMEGPAPRFHPPDV